MDGSTALSVADVFEARCPACGSAMRRTAVGGYECLDEGKIYGSSEVSWAARDDDRRHSTRCPTCRSGEMLRLPDGNYQCLAEDKIFSAREVADSPLNRHSPTTTPPSPDPVDTSPLSDADATPMERPEPEPSEHASVVVPTEAADQVMRLLLNEIDRVRVLSKAHAEEIGNLRGKARTQIETAQGKAAERISDTEERARRNASRFSPHDLGHELRLKLEKAFGTKLPQAKPTDPPASIEAAVEEWGTLTEYHWKVGDLITTLEKHRRRPWFLRLGRKPPVIPDDIGIALARLSTISKSLEALYEQAVAATQADKDSVVADTDAAVARVQEALADAIAEHSAEIDQAYVDAREIVKQVHDAEGQAGAPWGDERWSAASAAAALGRTIRLGELEVPLPGQAGIESIPALVPFPFTAGIAIGSGVDRRADAVALARSMVLRILAAVPPGDVRFVFLDPVSLGQSVAEFRHLAEFDQRLVDLKTWTSERDIEARLDELADHLEVVISNYLRGQFESIDEYNMQAGEVAEPYRVLVVFDYPEGFSERASRQLLSLIENGPRCGVHTVLVHDPARSPRDGVPTERLVHSMQRIDLDTRRLRLADPIGEVDYNFRPDPAPPVNFNADGTPETPFARMLLDIGAGARTSQSGPVTLERLLPIVNKLAASGRTQQMFQLPPGAPPVETTDPTTWWSGTSSLGAYAPIGRAGAQDVAGMFFSSTEVAGGAIIVGVPRSGKSTALHAAILSLALFYPPEELELYLVDSKHGVEFKIYEQLPHARLVSINSEREFSVSVLRSLDAEIARRADLMKRHAAGRANLTEYRKATGDRLPRIVLFMDEFHEVFEEDDALGQAAFQAFSNIVRQGPFAGVHIVVASQTLSSMPAMDRSTLSLLPMRVAFMCNELDADFVMGEDNREVKALSQQGEGIFNATRGNSAHNKPFRGTYVAPDEREAILRRFEDKARESGFGRHPRVFDGDTEAARSDVAPDRSGNRPVLAIGEPLTLEPYAAVTLRRGRAMNLLLLGADSDDGEMLDLAIPAAVDSCIVDAALQGLAVTVVDFLGDEGDGDHVGVTDLCGAVGATYRRGAALAATIAPLAEAVQARHADGVYDADGRLLVLNGLQRALDLAPEDPFGDLDDANSGPRPASMLARILRDGPDVGVHTLVVVDGLVQFDRRLGRDLLAEFGWRLAGSSLSVQDVQTVTESYTEGAVRRHQVLIADQLKAKTRRVRAYPRHTTESLADRNRKERM
jgi:hypothetical protein